LLAGSLFAAGYVLLGGVFLPFHNHRTLVFEESLNNIIIFIGICFITLMASILGDLLESLF
jgi:CDP-diglyceride synthetase